jgi:transcriptional regulator with XRE-family HTH domain
MSSPQVKRPSAPTSLDTQVSDRIKSIRVLKGLSQGAVAERLGIVHQQYHKYEAGVVRPSAGFLVKIADIFDCSVGELFPPDLRGEQSIESDTRMDVLKQELVSLIMSNADEKKLIALRTLLINTAE